MRWRDLESGGLDEVRRLQALAPHEILGVPINASLEEIRHAFRVLVKAYHPDRADPFMRIHNEQIIKVIIEAHDQMMERVRC